MIPSGYRFDWYIRHREESPLPAGVFQSRDGAGRPICAPACPSAPARPRVLFLACHLPWPATSGGRRREWELLCRLGRRFDIHLLVVSKTPGQDLAARHHLEPYCSVVEVLPALGQDRRGRPSDVPLVDRHRCPAATARVHELMAHGCVDLVHAEGFYLMQHVPSNSPAPTLLVEQNVEFELERQRIRVQSPPVAELSAFSSFLRTRSAEIASWRRATRIGALTPEDREMILATEAGAAVTLLPDGADHVPLVGCGQRPAARFTRRGTKLLFLANFAYSPNVDAAIYFTREVMPAVVKCAPQARLWLVGNAPPAEVRRLVGEHVEVTGRVPDVTPYLDAADAVVCPLRIGGGIKVKTVEALRRGKALVSTSIGVQGLPEEAREAVLVADAPGAFAQAVLTLLHDRIARRELEQRAAAAAGLLPTWDEAAEAVADVYLELAHGRGMAPSASMSSARATSRA